MTTFTCHHVINLESTETGNSHAPYDFRPRLQGLKSDRRAVERGSRIAREMGRLTCTCLNVSVHYKGSAWRGRPVSGSVLLRPPPSSGGVLGAEDRLARDELFEVELDVAGATAVSRGGRCVCVC